MNKLQDLKIWQKSIELAKEIYMIVSTLPKDEKFGLQSQIKRWATSVPSNIAEGAGRNSKKEFHHFLGIANGSLYELQTQLILSTELDFIGMPELDPILNKIVELQKNELFTAEIPYLTISRLRTKDSRLK